jgi:hypothetical protein
MNRTRIAVYAGDGSSHSWTWLARLFDSAGIAEARFLDAEGFARTLSDGPDVAIISGGDGHAIANALDGEGFVALEEFLRRGGLYVGICAGAYLPLPSSVHPFRQFNMSSTRIANIGDRSCCRDASSTRLAVPYGSCSVVHPVRGEIILNGDGESQAAPLYGGPIFREPTEDRVILRYSGFGNGTEFQMEGDAASSMVLGKPACILSRRSKGELLLFGPHLEHPHYPEANRLFLRLARLPTGSGWTTPRRAHGLTKGLTRSVADLKVAVLGLENRSFAVGEKLWDGGRLLELASAIESYGGAVGPEDEPRISDMLGTLTGELREVSDGAAIDGDAEPALLVEAARLCVDSYFREMAKSR